MKLLSWNVNGLRAAIRNGFKEFMEKTDVDVVCIQEIKVTESDIPAGIRKINGFDSVFFPARKKGYSGTAVFYRAKPLKIIKGIGIEKFDAEGRNITLEFKSFFLVNSYFPNSQHGLLRLDFKREYNRALLSYCNKLRKKKPVVICGDFNVAHKEIDLKNPKQNVKNAGFTPEEREDFSAILESGYIDTFRMFNSEPGHYTWWSYRFNARARNIGWRIDYFLVSKDLKNRVKRAEILSDVMGSDHCPVFLEIDI